MPRRCSSGRRSVSFPVRARTSQVLPWSMWPAVPTVSGMREPRRRRRRARRRRACGSRAAACRRGRSRSPAGRTRGAWARATPRPRRRRTASSASGSAPPPTRRTVSSTSPPTAAASRSARARTTGGVLAEHPQHGHLAQRPLGVEVEQQRSLERGEAELVDAQRAVQRMPAQALDQVGAADDDSGLRAAEQLVAAEADEVGAGGERVPRRRLVGEVARARPSRDRRAAARRALAQRRRAPPAVGRSVKPTTRKFDWWTRRSSAVVGPDRSARSRRTRVRFVVPTSTSVAPERASTSGIRKPSPISISSPRETSTSRPSASAASASSSAAALLLTTIAASAPVSRRRTAATWS